MLCICNQLLISVATGPAFRGLKINEIREKKEKTSRRPAKVCPSVNEKSRLTGPEMKPYRCLTPAENRFPTG